MILTGSEIEAMRHARQIIIEPFDSRYIEPNSYGFHLGSTLLEFEDEIVDPSVSASTRQRVIGDEGCVLLPRRFYLGHTLERIGGVKVSAELFANLSSAALGIWVQTSAPLGHVGAVINWTLEICVAQPVRVYPRMRIGKICFWQNFGRNATYSGRYAESTSVVSSRLFLDSA
jgi:dCTP deaminase